MLQKSSTQTNSKSSPTALKTAPAHDILLVASKHHVAVFFLKRIISFED
jgi:hypothetical protein